MGEDITESKEAERWIAHLIRVHAMLSAINTLIVHVRDRGELFRGACRIAVEVGAFKKAWLGVIDPPTLIGKVNAWFDGEKGDSDTIAFTARAGAPYSELPACQPGATARTPSFARTCRAAGWPDRVRTSSFDANTTRQAIFR